MRYSTNDHSLVSAALCRAPERGKGKDMADMSQFYTFAEARVQLGIDETKLKQLVNEGEIRARRDGKTAMMFRRTDIDTYKAEKVGPEDATEVIDFSPQQRPIEDEPATALEDVFGSGEKPE